MPFRYKMKNIKVAAVTINQTPLDWAGNRERILQAIFEAEKNQVQVLCFPELCLSGYGCEDAFYSPFVSDACLQSLWQILPLTQNKVITLGLPYFYKGSLFNTVAVIANQKILGFVPKKVLANDGVYYENRWFKPWDVSRFEEVELYNPITKSKEKIPFGDIYFNIGDIRFGLEICEEAWVANRIGAALAEKNVDVILNPSASHFAFSKQEIRKRFVIEGSRAFSVAYVFSNLLGNESGRIIFDGGALIASQGNLVLESHRFSFEDFEVFDAVVDIESNRIRRVQATNLKPDIGSQINNEVRSEFSWNFVKPAKINPAHDKESWEQSKFLKNEEFFRAVTLGLFDYLRKSRSSGYVISLSGGVDSSVVSVLAVYSLLLAQKKLTTSKWQKKLSYIKDLSEFVKKAVHVAYQGTKNSSAGTRMAAQLLAKELKVSYYEWDIDQVLKNYTELIEQQVQRKLTWETDDLSLQNIQARTRSPGIWLLANLKNALLLSTSNRSEAAVGYATMDGDTSGGLSPIAGVDKDFLNKWIRWCAEQGPEGFAPIASLKEVYKKPPTAELRPLSAHQEDEKDLMPYEVLEKIEREFIRERKSPLDVTESVMGHFPQISEKVIAGYVIKFLRLWSRNQWKRERYAPAFHLDDESLDPKTWCRYPILMASFDEEIRGLESKYLN